MSDGPQFIHLRVRSAYSLLEGALPIRKIASLARRFELPALALTDTNNLFGALEFSETLAGEGIQPIIGCTLAVDFADTEGGGRGPAQRLPAQRLPARRLATLALLASDEAGYANLMGLSSAAFLDDHNGAGAHVGLAGLRQRAEGLIALTGGAGGPVDGALALGRADLAGARLATLQEIYGDRLYVELQRHGAAGEAEIEAELLRLAYGRSLALVATNDVFFEGPDDHTAHDALICIADGEVVANPDRRRFSPNQHFRPPAEMAELFGDLPEALAGSVEIARRCTARPRLRAPILPRYPGEDDGRPLDEAAELERQARDGLEARLAAHGTAPGFSADDYRARLAHELVIINTMEFPGYFLIVAEIIKWSKAHGIPVGPGRGSGAASVVAWALTITDLDPLRFNLVFERFLNPHRVSMPDFDIDFCPVRRDEVIGHIRDTYGHDRVAQIITFGKLQARAVLRDVGRVLQMPYGQVDRLCKLVPNNPADPVTLAQAIEREPRLAEERDGDEQVARLLEIGGALEGLYRHASTHAAGIVIADRQLTDLVPLYRDPRTEMPVTQYNMKWVEQAGLVKFDILGLKTLTVLETCCAIVRDAGGPKIDISRIALDDRPTFELLGRGETLGVFQFESAGMRDLLVRAEPTNFEDLIALVALFRPGPMENIPKYLACKHGREHPEALHELIEPVVADTYGVIIYQEQVLQIAQRLAGFSLGEADLLRRAMGKKIKSEMDAQRARFISGAEANGVGRARAEHIFELVDKFAGYGFNKAHSAAYALVAYQTAYLKANHPLAFLAAVMTHDMGNTDKLALLRGEAERIGAAMLAPSINHSGADFSVEGNAIRYALAALRNVGRGAVEHIAGERASGGAFRSVADFASRVDPQIVSRRALESLVRAGAFDPVCDNRAALFAGLDVLCQEAQRAAAARNAGQSDMFATAGRSAAEIVLPEKEPWDAMTRLNEEFEAVGSYLSGHPLDGRRRALAEAGVTPWRSFEQAVREKGHRAGRLAGTVTGRRDRRGRTGNAYSFVSLSDPTGQYEAVVFSDVLAEAGGVLEPGAAVIIRVEAELDGERVRLRVQQARTLDEEPASAARETAGAAQEPAGVARETAGGVHLRVFIRDEAPLDALSSRLARCRSAGAGHDTVSLVVQDTVLRREVELEIGTDFRLGSGTAGAIKAIAGVVAVESGGTVDGAAGARDPAEAPARLSSVG